MATASQDSQPFHWHYSGFEDKSFHFHGRALLLIIILFSLLILFTLLCLYARWVCRYRHHPPAGPSSQEAPPGAEAVGLDLATINSFPTFLHRSSSEEAPAQCSICLCSFRDEEKVKVLPDCNHTYHPECVDKWLASRSSCPLCRASLRVDPALP